METGYRKLRPHRTYASYAAGDAEGDVTGVRWEQRKAVMRDAMIYNRNNPSIIFYESGNKGVRESNMQDMINLRNQYDPSWWSCCR
jgi:hypothetical protein